MRSCREQRHGERENRERFTFSGTTRKPRRGSDRNPGKSPLRMHTATVCGPAPAVPPPGDARFSRPLHHGTVRRGAAGAAEGDGAIDRRSAGSGDRSVRSRHGVSSGTFHRPPRDDRDGTFWQARGTRCVSPPVKHRGPHRGQRSGSQSWRGSAHKCRGLPWLRKSISYTYEGPELLPLPATISETCRLPDPDPFRAVFQKATPLIQISNTPSPFILLSSPPRDHFCRFSIGLRACTVSARLLLITQVEVEKRNSTKGGVV